MSADLFSIDPWGKQGELRVVVESPRGSGIKFKYDSLMKAFTVSRSFALGITYPFDWGFIPGTRNEDGDPVDALVIHDASTYPGIVLPCRVLGMIMINQKEGTHGKFFSNHLIIAMPVWHDRLGELKTANDLPVRIREELKTFFQTTTFFTEKKLIFKGWGSPRAATQLVNASIPKK